MNNLIFWIIVCSWLIPMGIRMYNRSRQRRIQDRGFPGQGYPGQGYPPQQFPGQNFPGQGYPPQNQPGQYPVIFPAEQQPQAGSGYDGASAPPSPTAPIPSPTTPGAEAQGYRARKLAELDAQFSNGEIAMEEYMKRRAEITNG